MDSDPRVTEIIIAFQKSWPNLSPALEGLQFPDDLNPASLLSSIDSTTKTSETILFCLFLKFTCYDCSWRQKLAQTIVISPCNPPAGRGNEVFPQITSSH